MVWEQVAESRRKISKEQGTIVKDWGGRLPIALVYPNTYYIGMSSLGFQIIYGMLNSFSEVVCERVFLEDQVGQGRDSTLGGQSERLGTQNKAARRVSSGAGGSRVISLESQREIREFALVAFSISFELDYLNVVDMLRRSGIPLLAADRGEGDPIVAAGGPCVFANPAPLVPFFDFLVIGEAEPTVPGLVETLQRSLHEDRRAILEELAKLPGIYVPGISKEPQRRVWAKDLNAFETASVVYSPNTELADMHLVEIARGCGRACRFCLAGFAFRPVRYRSVEHILESARKGLRFRKRVGLVAAATSDHPQIDEIAVSLRQMGAAVAVSSLRLNPLSEDLLRVLIESGTRTITFAPEAGSERLRQIVNKCVSSDDVLRGVSMAAALGVNRLKLYYMVGLPTETDADVEAIVDLTLKCKEHMEDKRRGAHITASITPFVPKAGTPFQWEAMEDAETISRRLKLIKSGLKKRGIEVRAESVDWSVVQAVLARGDDRLSDVLARMYDKSPAAWADALAAEGLSPGDYTGPRHVGEELPWSIVDMGGSIEAIRRQRDKALGQRSQ